MPATITTSYAQTVTALARQYHELAVDGEVLPGEWFRITAELHAAADHAKLSHAVASADLKDEIEAGPVKR